MEAYTNMEVHGVISQTSAQGTNDNDVVKYGTYKPIVISGSTPAAPSGVTLVNGQIVVCNSGAGPTYLYDGTNFILQGGVTESYIGAYDYPLLLSSSQVGNSTSERQTTSVQYLNAIYVSNSGNSPTLVAPDIKTTNISPANSTTGTVQVVTNGGTFTFTKQGKLALPSEGSLATAGATDVPSAGAVRTAISDAFGANDAMVFKGTIGSSGATVAALPAVHQAGWTYKVITAGEYAGNNCEIGDMIICVKDRTSGADSNDEWTVVQSNIDGAVTGPSSGVSDGDIAIFDNSGTRLKTTSQHISSTVDNDTNIPTNSAVRTYVSNYVKNGKLTIQGNSTTAVEFTANQSGNVALNLDPGDGITITTDTSGSTEKITIGHSTSVSGGAKSNIGSATAVPVISYDAMGHITAMSTATIYPPTSAGTNGQVWKSDGSGQGVWTNQSALSVGSAGKLVSGGADVEVGAWDNPVYFVGGVPQASSFKVFTQNITFSTGQYYKSINLSDLPSGSLPRIVQVYDSDGELVLTNVTKSSSDVQIQLAETYTGSSDMVWQVNIICW